VDVAVGLVSGNAVVHTLTSAAGGPTYTVLETSGRVRLSHTLLTAPFTDKLPAAPGLGMQVDSKMADTSLSNSNTLTVNGNGKNVEYLGVQAGTQTFNPGTMGTGGCITWTYNGLFWESS